MMSKIKKGGASSLFLKSIIIIIIMMINAYSFEYKWGYLSVGSYFDHYEGSNPLEWESRGEGRPYPPRRPAPQSLYNVKGVGYFEIIPNHSLGIESDVFYNRVEEYNAFVDGQEETLSENTVGLGDLKFKLVSESKEIGLYYGLQFVIPGVYERSGIDFEGASAKARPWTGLGAFRIGAETLFKYENHSVALEALVALPELDRSAIESGSYELSLTYNVKKKFKNGNTVGTGIWTQYKDFNWRFPEEANRKDLGIFPMISMGWVNDAGNREYSITTGISALSWVKDSTVIKAPGSYFVSIYMGFY